jgi:nucleoid-associated protein YgaU
MIMKNRTPQKKIYLKKPGIFLLWVIAFIIFASIGIKATAANLSFTNNHPAYIEVMVKSGDSLWELAETYYQGNEDIRKIIYRIKKINNLESAEIYPGQLIKIPQV